MDNRAEIERRRAEFVAAFNREDLAALRELSADEIVMIPPNQPPVIGVDASIEWWTTGFQASRTALHVTPRELYVADGWALDWFDWVLTLVPLGGTTTAIDHGSSFWVWRRQPDEIWRVLRSMWNSRNETPSLWAGGVADFPVDETPLM
jgi:ketosteroid isomerase-like protein